MFIDMHVHPDFYEVIYENDELTDLRRESLSIYKNGIASLQHIKNQMKCAHIDKLCLFANSSKIVGNRHSVSNVEIKKIVDASPNDFIGFASVNPLESSAIEELIEAFEILGLRGLKLNPSRDKYLPSDPRLKPIYDLCLKYDRPIVFHSGLSWEKGSEAKWGHPLHFEPLAIEYPKLRICLAHFGWPWVRETAMLMLKYPNVYADTAALYFDDAETFYLRIFTHDLAITWIDRSLRNQVMFGSDNPRFEQIRMAHALEKLGLRDDTLKKIKGINAQVFLGDRLNGKEV